MCALLSACDSNFVPDRQHPRRAVESPHSLSSANSEVMGGPAGAVSLMSIELPNNKDESPVVHTIADRVSVPTTSRPAASQPATQPATQPEPPPVKDELKIVAQQRPADQFRLTRDNEANADLWVLCPSGIGTVTLQRTADWPPLIRVHLRYDLTREFSRLEGFTASEVTPAGAKIPLKTTANKETAQAQIAIPGFARSPRIQIEWIDAYR